MTGPIATPSCSAPSRPCAIASMPKCSCALRRARSPSASRSPSESAMISRRASAHFSASGGRSQPVRSSGGASTTLSVGPPELHARTGRPQTIASTGPMPKCSFVGVYSSASVEGAERSAERCAVVKLRRKRTSGSVGVRSKGGMVTCEVDGVRMLKVSVCAFAPSMSPTSVIMLSSSLESYPPGSMSGIIMATRAWDSPAMTKRMFPGEPVAKFLRRRANAFTASAAFFFPSNRFKDRSVGRSLSWVLVNAARGAGMKSDVRRDLQNVGILPIDLLGFVCCQINPRIHDLRRRRDRREVGFEDACSELRVGENDISLSYAAILRITARREQTCPLTCGDLLQPVHRKTIDTLQHTSSSRHSPFDERSVGEKLVREVAVEHDPCVSEYAQQWHTRRQLVHKVYVVRRCPWSQQVACQVQLAGMREQDVELSLVRTWKWGYDVVYAQGACRLAHLADGNASSSPQHTISRFVETVFWIVMRSVNINFVT